MDSEPRAAGDARSVARSAIGWAVALLLVGAAYVVHQGLGPPPGGMVHPDQHWYQPTRFLLERAPFDGFVDRPLGGIALVAVPLAAGVLLVFWGTRSALARTLATTALFASCLFAFYGLAAPRVWEFFKWRGSLVMVLTALCVAAAATAPTLARAWLRRGWLLRAALYVPVFLAVVTLERNLTGTDERLAFNFSPWPAVPIFGLEIGAYLFVGLWLGIAAGLVLLAARAGRWSSLAAVALAVGVPVLWLALRFRGIGAGWLAAMAVVGAAGLAIAALAPREQLDAVRLRRAGVIGLGALLAGLPLFTGRAWADADFAVTRHVRAKRISDALARYMERKDEYPESLSTLVEQGYLDRVPRPRIGFTFPYELDGEPLPSFSYQNLGSSYVLEFAAPEWVQCAYNPPWEDWEDEETEDADPGPAAEENDPASDELYGALGDDAGGEAWSCPDTRPDLW